MNDEPRSARSAPSSFAARLSRSPADLPTRTRDSKVIATGPPWFLAYVLFDGDSTLFGDFMRNRIQDLGAAWGEEILGVRIGHPGQRDAVYERMRSEQRCELDERGVTQYEELVRKRGGAGDHDLRETRWLVSHFGLSAEDLPALVLETLPSAPRPAVLRIPSDWLSRPGSQRILSRGLASGLSPRRIRKLVQNRPVGVAVLSRQMQGVLDDLRENIERQVAGETRARRSTARELDESYHRSPSLRIWVARSAVEDHDGSRTQTLAVAPQHGAAH